MPYPQELNDIPQIVARKREGAEFADMIVDAFSVMHDECVKRPLVMGIALHPYIVGQPHRFKHLKRALGHIAGKADERVWFTTSGETLTLMTLIGSPLPGGLSCFRHVTEFCASNQARSTAAGRMLDFYRLSGRRAPMITLPNPLNIMFPGAAGNYQTFDFWSPTISVNYAGNRAVEREVNEDVASFGTQIGWLNDIVIALAHGHPCSARRDRGRSARSTN